MVSLVFLARTKYDICELDIELWCLDLFLDLGIDLILGLDLNKSAAHKSSVLEAPTHIYMNLNLNLNFKNDDNLWLCRASILE